MQKKLIPGLPSAIRPGTEPPVLMRRLWRHAGWSRSVAGKFQQKTERPGCRPESLVYRRHRGVNFLLLRNLQRFHLGPRATDTVRAAVNHFIFNQTNVFHPAQQAARQLQSDQPQTNGSAPNTTVLWARRPEQLCPPLERVVERLRLLHSSGRVSARLANPRQGASNISNRVPRRANSEPDGFLDKLVGRIMRQAHRVEERPPDPPSSLLPATPALHGAADFVHEAPRFIPVKDVSSAGPDPIPAPTPAMAFNVVQLTDEVMRQLDRRLVAARERMGRT